MEWGIKQGAKLKELRMKKGFDIPYVANKLSKHPTTVSTWESGLHRPPVAVLKSLAFLYNVPIEEITGDYIVESAPEPASPESHNSTPDLLALLSMLTDKTEQEITAEAVKHYALMFNWSDCIKQKYFDETDQL